MDSLFDPEHLLYGLAGAAIIGLLGYYVGLAVFATTASAASYNTNVTAANFFIARFSPIPMIGTIIGSAIGLFGGIIYSRERQRSLYSHLPVIVLPQASGSPPPSISPLAANDKFIPTSVARQVMGLPEDNVLRNTLVAVLDTGGPWPWHPQVQGLTEATMSFVPFEPSPLDGHGHGSWCTTAAIGKEANTTYGLVKGAATAGSKVIFAKVLSNLGMGNTSWIIKGMEWAYLQGAKVISMSLGGEPQGGVDDDPFCQVINTLYRVGVYTVVASGDSGPSLWTLASPGFCPNALTVGAYVITDNDISWFSSNGPSNG